VNTFPRHWYSLGLIPAAVMAAWLVWQWNEIIWVQKLLALNFIVLILHQFEEFDGGVNSGLLVRRVCSKISKFCIACRGRPLSAKT
jgi:hypothetical protein